MARSGTSSSTTLLTHAALAASAAAACLSYGYLAQRRARKDEVKQQPRTLVLRGNLADCCADAAAPFGFRFRLREDHVVVVRASGVIAAVCPATSPEGIAVLADHREAHVRRLGKHEVLIPGMIDTHIHAPQYSYTGTATDLPLMQWLKRYTFPAERRLKDVAKARGVYTRLVKRTLGCGTTTAVYFATIHVAPCLVLADICRTKGQRAYVAKVCMDRCSPADYVEASAAASVAACRDFIRDARRADAAADVTLRGLVEPALAPRFIPTCTPRLMSALGKLAEEENVLVTTHVSESHDSMAFVQHLHRLHDQRFLEGEAPPDKTKAPVTEPEILDAHGLLRPRCVLAHGVHLKDADLDLLKTRGAAVSHCPLSNFFFANGVLPTAAMMRRGDRLGLGTDVAGGYSPSMLSSMRHVVVADKALTIIKEEVRRESSKNKKNANAASEADADADADADANDDDADRLDFRHGLFLATLGGARAIGEEARLGSIEVGKEFDAVLLSAAAASSSNVDIFDEAEEEDGDAGRGGDTLRDVLQKLLNNGDDRNVRCVWVRGRLVVG